MSATTKPPQRPQTQRLDPRDTIGQMNGPWAFLLKVTLVLVPTVFIPWATYMTVNQVLDIQFREQGPRWTEPDANRRESALKSDIVLTVSQMLQSHINEPEHAVATVRIAAMERRIDDIAVSLKSIELLLSGRKQAPDG